MSRFFIAGAVLAVTLVLFLVPVRRRRELRVGADDGTLHRQFHPAGTDPRGGDRGRLAVLRHGRLHRYNTAPGEVAETALLEEEFAAFTGRTTAWRSLRAAMRWPRRCARCR